MDVLPPSLAGELRDLRQRITVLERSNKLLASTISGGTLNVLNDAGTIIAQLGELIYGATGFSLTLSNGTTPLLKADQTSGFGIPWLSTEWKQPSESVAVTAAAYPNSVWSSTTELLYATELRFRVSVFTDAATAGEVRLSRNGTIIGNVLTVPANTAVTQHDFRIAHGFGIGSGPFQFDLEARRTSGAGSFLLFHPHPLHYGTNMSTVAGGWV